MCSLRRDFTINAMAAKLQGEDRYSIIDPFDGLADLHDRLIITPLDPHQTFSDDPLRMMRAIRFASQLSFDIDSATLDAITSMRDRISIVSMERISYELNKIILSPIPSKGFLLLDKTGLLKIIFPELEAMKGVEQQAGYGHKDIFIIHFGIEMLLKALIILWLRWRRNPP